MKNILFITAFTPSKFSAGQNYTKNFLGDISSNYKVDLIYFKYEDQDYAPENENINILKIVTVSKIRKFINVFLFPFVHPIFSFRFSLETLFFMKRKIRTRDYDVIYFDFSQIFLYSLFIRHQNKILMAHDVMFQKFLRQGLSATQLWISWSEKILFAKANTRIWTFSKKDQILIRDKYHRESEIVNFYISPQILSLNSNGSHLQDYFCLFAAWNRAENYEGLEWFIKNVVTYSTNTKYVIIGINLPPRLSDIVKQLKNVEYLGFIDNPYVYIAQAKALIAPIFKGAGVKVKVIESLACGTPVIGTNIALEGVAEVTKESLIECNSAEEFVRVILNFNISQNKKDHIRGLFLENYSRNRKLIFN